MRFVGRIDLSAGVFVTRRSVATTCAKFCPAACQHRLLGSTDRDSPSGLLSALSHIRPPALLWPGRRIASNGASLGRTPPLQGKGCAFAGGLPAFRASLVQAGDAPPP